MPRKGRKRPDSFTLIVVPHSEKASFSIRVPFWTIYVAAGLCAIALGSVCSLALDYQHTAAQLAELRRGGQIGIVQQKDLRADIAMKLSQQDSLREVIADQNRQAAEVESERAQDASLFNQEVTRLYAQIAELEQFKSDIRKIVGLEKDSPAPAAAPKAAAPSQPAASTAVAAAPAATTAQPAPAASAAAVAAAQPPAAASASAAAQAPAPVSGQIVAGALAAPAQDVRAAASVSNRGNDPAAAARDAIQSTQALIDNSVPQQKADLEALKTEVQDRVAKVGTDWTSPDQLSRQLDMYDASPRGWPVYGQVGEKFGYYARRIDIGAQPFHAGIDILAPMGTPIRAPADGVVTSAGWNGTYGLELQLRHTMGWSTLYAHMQSFAVKAGESVKKGQVLGYIGMTGLTTGSHVHYEIHLNGTPVDPTKYLGK